MVKKMKKIARVTAAAVLALAALVVTAAPAKRRRCVVLLGIATSLALGSVAGSTLPAEADTSPSYRVIVGEDGLRVRSGPSTSTRVVGGLFPGDRVRIICTVAHGTLVKGPLGTTSVWNKIGDGRWVPDAFIKTYSSRPVAPECTSGPASAPTTPADYEPPGLRPLPPRDAPGMWALGGYQERYNGQCSRNSARPINEGERNVDPHRHAQPWRVTQVTRSPEKYLETTTQKQIAVSRVLVTSWCTNRTLEGGVGQHNFYRTYTPIEYVHRTRNTTKNCYGTGCWGVPLPTSDWKPGTG